MKTSSDQTADTPLPYTRTEARLPLTPLDRAPARVRPHATRRPLVVRGERLPSELGDARLRARNEERAGGVGDERRRAWRSSSGSAGPPASPASPSTTATCARAAGQPPPNEG